MVAQFVFLMLVIAAGMNIPLPGLNAQFVAQQAQAASSGMHSLSIFALAAVPILSALTLLEIAKLIFPRLETWRLSSEKRATGIHVFVMVLVVSLAVMNGSQLVYFFHATSRTNISEGYLIAGLGCYVGATLVMIWLADRIRLAGIASGVWLLLAIFYLSDLGTELSRLFEYTRMGMISAWQGLLYCAFLLAGILALVAINRTVELASRNDMAEKMFFLSALLWTPFLAGFIASYLVAISYAFLAEVLLIHVQSFIFILFSIIEAVLIPLIILAYYRFIRISRPDIVCKDHVRPILLCIAGIQLLLALGLGFARDLLAFPATLSGNILIVCITVLYLIGTALRPGSLAEA